eukprot:2533806-Amphidinium_carterae.1
MRGMRPTRTPHSDSPVLSPSSESDRPQDSELSLSPSGLPLSPALCPWRCLLSDHDAPDPPAPGRRNSCPISQQCQGAATHASIGLAHSVCTHPDV